VKVSFGAMDPLWNAMSKLRRGRLEECIAICDTMLYENPTDQVICFTLMIQEVNEANAAF
jgi:hypothetical protein